MHLTKSQQHRFWRDWQSAIRHQGWQHEPSDQLTARRHALLKSVGFNSLTEVDRAAGFDRLLAALGQLRDNVTKTLETDRPDIGDRRRLHWQIEQLTDHLSFPYVESIMKSRFGHTRLDDLSTIQLTQLRNTLHARHQSKRRKSTGEGTARPLQTAETPF